MTSGSYADLQKTLQKLGQTDNNNPLYNKYCFANDDRRETTL